MLRPGVALPAVVLLVMVPACADDSATADRASPAPTSATATVHQAPPTAASAPAGPTDIAAPDPTFEVQSQLPDGDDGPCGWFAVTELHSMLDRALAKAGTDLEFESSSFRVCTQSGELGTVSASWHSEEVNMRIFVADALSDPGMYGVFWEGFDPRSLPMLDDAVRYWVSGTSHGTSGALSASLWFDSGRRFHLWVEVANLGADDALTDPEIVKKWNDPDYWDPEAWNDPDFAWNDPDFLPVTEKCDAFTLALVNEFATAMGWIG